MSVTKTLQEVMQEHPQLCSLGYRVEWKADELGNFASWRADLAADVVQFAKSAAWVARYLEQRVTINRRYNSYELKHICERSTGYITNGTFIAAMIANGYTANTRVSLNPWFNVTTKSVRYADFATSQAAHP